MAQPPASTVTLYGPDDQPVAVPAGEAAALLRSGQYGMAEGQTVPMQGDDGSWQDVGAEEAVRRAQSHTARVGSAVDVERTEKEREFGGLGTKALAAGTGVVKSLGLGFGDAALVKGAEFLGGEGSGRRVAQFIQDADTYAPGSRMAGEAAGFLLPMLATGGGGGLARGALRGVTAPARALTAGGEALGEMAAGAVGRAGAPNLGRVLAPAVGQAAELGVYGAGDAVSRAIVRDPNVDGEALAAQMGQGFLHGAQMGGAMGLGIGVLGAGARYGLRRAGDAVSEARASVGEFISRQSLPGAGLAARAEEMAGRGLDAATGAAERATGRSITGEAATLGEKADKLARTAFDVDKMSVETALKSTGADQGILKKTAKFSPELKAVVARQVVEDLPRLAGKDGRVLSHVDQAEASQLLRREAGEKLGGAIDRLDATGTRLDVRAATAAARKEVVEPLRKIAGADTYASRVESYLKDLERVSAEDGTMAFKEFHQQRSFLDDMIFEARVSKSPAQKALEKMRGTLEAEFTKAADKAAGGVGGSFAAEYRALKAEYRAAKWVEEATAKGAARSGANRTIGMSEQFGVISGAVLGGGGPVGLAMAAGGAVVNRAVKSYGDQAAAAVLREMQAGKPLAAAVADVARRNLGEQVGKFFQAVREPAAKALERGKAVVEGVKENVRGGVQRAKDATIEAGRDVARVASRTERGAATLAQQKAAADEYEQRRRAVLSAKAGGPLRVEATARRFVAAGADPQSARVAAETAAKGAAYLAAKMPPVPQRSQTLQPELARDLPSPEEMDRWLRIARVVDNPDTLLERMGRGLVTPEETDVWRELYPHRYQQLQMAMSVEVQQLTEAGIRIPERQAKMIGDLFGVVASPTQDPAFGLAIQATYQPQPPAPGLAPSSRRPPNTAHLYTPGQEAP